MSGDRTRWSVVIDARAIILYKRAAAESVGGREDGGHRRCDGGERSGEGRGVVGRSGQGEVRGKKTTERSKVGWATRLFPFPVTSRLFVQNTERNNSTALLASRISVSPPCLSLNIASLATRRVALCDLKAHSSTKAGRGKDDRR